MPFLVILNTICYERPWGAARQRYLFVGDPSSPLHPLRICFAAVPNYQRIYPWGGSPPKPPPSISIIFQPAAGGKFLGIYYKYQKYTESNGPQGLDLPPRFCFPMPLTQGQKTLQITPPPTPPRILSAACEKSVLLVQPTQGPSQVEKLFRVVPPRRSMLLPQMKIQ